MTRKKKLKKFSPSIGKKISPTITTEKDWDQYNPIFSLHQLNTKFCLKNCTKDEQSLFSLWLYKLSRLTWNQIKRAGTKGLGFEKIRTKTINASIPSGIESKTFIVFHDYAPICGYREDRIFHIIWIDREYKLYKH